jgi:hypothetical protein
MENDNKISRRSLLRSTATLTAGNVVAGAPGRIDIAAAEPAPPPPTETAVAPDHDPATGEIFDRERHHHWDTV